jgi:hypothetical protein
MKLFLILLAIRVASENFGDSRRPRRHTVGLLH